MKIEINIEEVDVLETYTGKAGRRDWGRISWMYPGDIVVQVSGESAFRIKAAIVEDLLHRQGKPTPEPST